MTRAGEKTRTLWQRNDKDLPPFFPCLVWLHQALLPDLSATSVIDLLESVRRYCDMWYIKHTQELSIKYHVQWFLSSFRTETPAFCCGTFQLQYLLKRDPGMTISISFNRCCHESSSCFLSLEHPLHHIGLCQLANIGREGRPLSPEDLQQRPEGESTTKRRNRSRHAGLKSEAGEKEYGRRRPIGWRTGKPKRGEKWKIDLFSLDIRNINVVYGCPLIIKDRWHRFMKYQKMSI